MAIHSVEIKNIQGLSEEEATLRLKTEGYNELPSAREKSLWRIIAHVLSEPMLLLLLVASGIYLILGDLKEALLLTASAFGIIGITIYQERKTEKALEALRDLSSPRASVIRAGEQRRIPGREVVRDDILFLKEGDRVPADAFLISCTNLSVNESLLTGESVPVRKISLQSFSEIINSKKAKLTELKRQSPGGDDLPWIYSGTLIVQGQGIAQVEAIGLNSEIGKIGTSLQILKPEETSLKKESRKLILWFAVLGLTLCIFIALLYGFTHRDFLNGLLVGITLAMSMIPEEIPVVLTIFLALGAWRISKVRVLTRQVPAVETLGAATILCVDKTGTLTLNEMKIAKICAQAEFYSLDSNSKELPETFHELIEFGILASQKDPFDPMEKAIRDFGESLLKGTEHLHRDWTLVHEYPLSHHLLAISHVWQSRETNDYAIAAKGSPEAIVDLCHLSSEKSEEVLKNVQALAKEGLRVLGVAKAHFNHPPLPEKQHDFEFKFVGLIGFTDPIRPEVPAAIQECYEAGIRILMMTGDYPATAQNIACQIGLKNSDLVLTGTDLEKMDDQELENQLKQVNIFARMIPSQKLRLVEALKANGEIVAMTGDGVNDAPALKSAHIGIAMGKRGTDVAREAASLVLVNDDFYSIVAAVKVGRRIFDNLKKAILYIFSIHVVIAGVALFPVLLGWPLLLLPIHIVFLELIIDPACSIVFEAETEEKNIMKRSPRSTQESLFERTGFFVGLLQGMSLLIPVLILFRMGIYQEFHARTVAFTTLILGNLGLILVNRSKTKSFFRILTSPNLPLWWVSSGTLFFLILILSFNFTREIFRFSLMNWKDLAICSLALFLSVGGFVGVKKFFEDNKKLDK